MLRKTEELLRPNQNYTKILLAQGSTVTVSRLFEEGGERIGLIFNPMGGNGKAMRVWFNHGPSVKYTDMYVETCVDGQSQMQSTSSDLTSQTLPEMRSTFRTINSILHEATQAPQLQGDIMQGQTSTLDA